MKKFALISVLGLVLLAFLFCQKRLFHTVHVKGRLLHFFSRQPISGVKIELLADDATSAKDSRAATTDIATAVTGSDGVYELKGRASRTDSYYIRSNWPNYNDEDCIAGGEHNSSGIKLALDKITDVGDFLTGKQTFYCRVTLNINQGAKDTVDFLTRKFGGPTHTSFIDNLEFNHQQYETGGHTYYRTYSIKRSGVTTYTSFSVPITYPDTMQVSITF